MRYIKATKQECEAYNNSVTQSENYTGGTTQWGEVREINGEFYVAEHSKYPHNFETVSELPSPNEI